MELAEIREQATRLSAWSHLATVGADGEPDVVPVHPCWEGDTIWIMGGIDSVKARTIGHQPKVAMHWQVTEIGDGVQIWGAATIHSDLETKKRLWCGVFDYDLNAFAPGGPDNSPGTAFIAIKPERAIYLEMYGMNGTHRWKAS